MYFSLTVVSALLATVSASSLGLMRRQYPDCASPCITNVDYHGCSASSIPCLCKNSDYVKETTACMVASCSGDDLQQALGVAQGLCESVVCGVTLQSSDVLPATSTASGGSAASSATTTSAGTSSSSTGSNAALNLNGLTALTGLAAGGLVALLL
ncbi:hypothetical protein BDZ89DRAFT_1059744 [Hymenopellis radicata]|nr:hypothetical protein BDZ89DRAFT_1059744 [Hymenopellis radicata]